MQYKILGNHENIGIDKNMSVLIGIYPKKIFFSHILKKVNISFILIVII